MPWIKDIDVEECADALEAMMRYHKAELAYREALWAGEPFPAAVVIERASAGAALPDFVKEMLEG